MENYFASQRDNIFRNVEVLIYVFDVESRELEKVHGLKKIKSYEIHLNCRKRKVTYILFYFWKLSDDTKYKSDGRVPKVFDEISLINYQNFKYS